DVTPASAASVVIPSKVSPGPSPYIGWKWSNPHMPSKPRSSARRTRRTSSSQGMRCCATSRPNLMAPVLADELGDAAVEAPDVTVPVEDVVVATDELHDPPGLALQHEDEVARGVRLVPFPRCDDRVQD